MRYTTEVIVNGEWTIIKKLEPGQIEAVIKYIEQNVVEREMREEVLNFYNDIEGSIDGYGKVTV